MTEPTPSPAPKLASDVPQPPAGSVFRRTWFHVAVLLVCGFVCRFPALQGELIWDDLFLARDNPLIKSPLLIVETFRHYLQLDSYSMHYRPMQNISYMVDYFFWNSNLYGYHLSNVLWHAGSGVLLYLLLFRLLRTVGLRGSFLVTPAVAKLTALGVALLWVVHPVHSAAVDYVAGRADSLAFFFACGSWLLFMRASDATDRRRKLLLYASATVAALAALCSRESACMWMCVFLFWVFAFDKSPLRLKVVIAAACLVLLAGYAGLRQLPGPRPTLSPTAGWTAPMRSVLMLRALGDYGRLMVFPSSLHMERSVFDPLSNKGTAGWRDAAAVEYLSIGGLLTALALLAGACWRSPQRRLRAFGAGWFVLAFLPISNLFELNATVAEHWIYLASVGLLIFFAGVWLDLPSSVRRLGPAFAGLAVLALGTRSFVRSSDWITAETFYQRTLAAGGTSVRVLLNLGQIYASRGDDARAEALFRQVLTITPDFLIARNNLGSVLQHEGKIDEASAVFIEADSQAAKQRAEYPRTWIAALNRAHMHIASGDKMAALETLTKARADYPGTWGLISLEAEVRRTVGDVDGAIRIVQEFSDANWWHAAASTALGRLYAEHGDVARSEAALRHSSWLDVHDAEALSLLAQIRVRENRLGEAYTTQRRAVARQPDEPRHRVALSGILDKMGRTDEARATLAQVAQLEASVQAHERLN